VNLSPHYQQNIALLSLTLIEKMAMINNKSVGLVNFFFFRHVDGGGGWLLLAAVGTEKMKD